MRSVITFLFVSGGHLAGTQSFSRIIKDDDTRAPIEDVHIQVVISSLGSASDKDGEFALDNFPKGIRTIRIAAVGYSTLERTVKAIPLIKAKIKQALSDLA